MSEFNEEKALNAMLYLAERSGGKIEPHLLFNMLYLADRAHMLKWGCTITGDTYTEMKPETI